MQYSNILLQQVEFRFKNFPRESTIAFKLLKDCIKHTSLSLQLFSHQLKQIVQDSHFKNCFCIIDIHLCEVVWKCNTLSQFSEWMDGVGGLNNFLHHSMKISDNVPGDVLSFVVQMGSGNKHVLLIFQLVNRAKGNPNVP